MSSLSQRLKLITQRPPALWVIIALAASLWLGEYVRRGLWEPDEARYAYVAKEMSATGCWFAPRLHNEPYPDKPPLLFWLMNLSSTLTHNQITSLSARLPSFLGSILTVWAITRMLAAWDTPQSAWRAMMVLLTSFMFWQEGGWARTDGLLCGLEMMSLYFLFKAADSRRSCHWALAFLFVGLAALEKGPVGLLIPLGIFVVATMAVGDTYKLRGPHWVWGIPLALCLPALWLLLAWHSHAPASYFHDMFTSKSVGRVIESKGHNNPVTYFFWNFPLDFLPWTFLLPTAWLALSRSNLRLRLTAWLGFVIWLFSLFVCKREIYILAAYPAAAMIIGAGWERISSLSERMQKRPVQLVLGILWILALVEILAYALPSATAASLFKEKARLQVLPCLPLLQASFLIPALVLTTGVFLSTRTYCKSGVKTPLLIAIAATLFFHEIAVSTNVYHAINALKSPTVLAHDVDQRVPPGQPLYLYEEQLAILPLYADRPGRQLHSMAELESLIARDPSCVVVFMKTTWDQVRPTLPQRHEAHASFVGGKDLVWVEFLPPAALP